MKYDKITTMMNNISPLNNPNQQPIQEKKILNVC